MTMAKTPSFDEMYPSKHLKASDLKGKAVKVQIEKVQMEEIGKRKEWLPVLYFLKANKGMVLNKTNGRTLKKAFGEPSGWRGKTVELFAIPVEFEGEMTEGLRLRAASSSAQAPREDEEPAFSDEDAPPPEQLDEDVNPFD